MFFIVSLLLGSFLCIVNLRWYVFLSFAFLVKLSVLAKKG